jgi:hypothetical protein
MRRRAEIAGVQRGDIAQASGVAGLFVDRESERRRIEEAVHGKQCLMICGPPGIGKTELVLKVIGNLPKGLSGRCIYLKSVKDLQDLLRQLIRALDELKDPTLRQDLHKEGISVSNFDEWLKSLSGSRLKGTLYRTVGQGDYHIFLDHLPPLTQPVAKIIKELFWMRKTPVCLLLSDAVERRIEQFSNFFYWGPRERLSLKALPEEAARELLENCIARFGLSGLELEDFREEVLELSKQVPGAIVKMCMLAAKPCYQYESRIKVTSVYIDYLIMGHNLNSPEMKWGSNRIVNDN